MNWHKTLQLFLVPFLFICASCDRKESSTNEGLQLPEEEAIIREQVQSYTDALNQRNLNALADHWSEEAIYRNQLTGTLVQGREEIKAEFQKIFDQLGDAKIDMEVESIRFPFEDKATEKGMARMTIPGEAPVESDYKMIYVKRNGKWLILNVSQLDLGILNQTPMKE